MTEGLLYKKLYDMFTPKIEGEEVGLFVEITSPISLTGFKIKTQIQEVLDEAKQDLVFPIPYMHTLHANRIKTTTFTDKDLRKFLTKLQKWFGDGE